METVHRDIKAENILVQYRTSDYIAVKLADFGLSKEYDNLSTVCGNRAHLAPEVYYSDYLTLAGVEGRKSYNSAVDIWSLGTVVYRLLCRFPEWKDNYILRGTTWAEKILDRFQKDYGQRPGELKHFLLQAMVVIRPEQRWSAKACLLAAESLCAPVQGRQKTPTPTSPLSGSERTTFHYQKEQSTIVQNTPWRPSSSGIASGSMAAHGHLSSGASSPEYFMQTNRKRPTIVSASSSGQNKRRGDSSSAAQTIFYVNGNRTHASDQERDGDAQGRTRHSINRLLPSRDGLDINSSPTARSRPGGDNPVQALEALKDQDVVGAADLLQQMRQRRHTDG